MGLGLESGLKGPSLREQRSALKVSSQNTEMFSEFRAGDQEQRVQGHSVKAGGSLKISIAELGAWSWEERTESYWRSGYSGCDVAVQGAV